jgi:hypothetical protein
MLSFFHEIFKKKEVILLFSDQRVLVTLPLLDFQHIASQEKLNAI